MNPQATYLQDRARDVEAVRAIPSPVCQHIAHGNDHALSARHQVETTIRELGSIFGELANIVSEQGEMVQRCAGVEAWLA
jgi:hypothetical protein|eukprot:SAG25_NODE_939_length_4667_cov_9.559379_4_plen_80_part_00